MPVTIMQLNCPYENFKKSILPVYIHCDSFPYKWSDFILSKINLFFGWEICSSWKVVRLSYLKPCWYVLVFFFLIIILSFSVWQCISYSKRPLVPRGSFVLGRSVLSYFQYTSLNMMNGQHYVHIGEPSKLLRVDFY